MVDSLNYFSFQPVLHDWCNNYYDFFNVLFNTFLINGYIGVGNILIGKIPSGYLTGIDLSTTACQTGACWCNKGRGIYCPLCRWCISNMVLIIEKSTSYSGGGSGFSLSLYESSFTIILCHTQYNRKENVFSVSLNKTFLLWNHLFRIHP